MTSIRVQYPLLLLITIVLWFLPFLANAYTLSPKVLDIETEKRDIQTRDITIVNGSGPARIYPVVNEISVDEDGEIKAFEYATNDDRYDSITSWLEISRGRIQLAPNETKVIPLTIRINPNAEPGLYHAFVAFANASNKDQAKQMARSGQAPGVLVRIAIDQERTEFLRLENFTVERFVVNPEEEVLSYTVTNPGQAEIAPRGEVIFYNNQGSEIASVPINPESTEIDPDNTLSFTSSIPDDFKAGKYKAFLSLEYGNEQLASLNDTTFFYVMPISTMIIIFVSVLLFAIFLTVLIYRRTAPVQTDGVQDVSMYMRQGTTDSQDHDIDLKQNKSE